MADRLKVLFAVGIVIPLYLCGAQTSVTELNFGKVRGNKPSNPSKSQAERLLGRYAPTEERAIYCTDSVYPNNIFCDLSIELPESGQSRYQIAEMELSYMDPLNDDSFCTMKLKVTRNVANLRFDYHSVSCSESAKSSPMLRVASLTAIEVISRRKDNDYGACVARYENAGGIKWPSGTSLGNKPPIKFTIGFQGCYTSK